jgi:hypothetical protein
MNATTKLWASIALLLSFMQPVGADEGSIDSPIWLGGSAFDLHVDPDHMGMSEKAIFLSLIPVGRDFMAANQDQIGFEFRIDYLEKIPGTVRGWRPDGAKPVAADEAAIDGFGNPLVAEGLTTSDTDSGYSFLYTPDDSEAFYGSCDRIIRVDDRVNCSVNIRYAFDDTLRIFISALPPEDRDLADFEAIAIAVHNFVKCELDVTPTDSPRQMRPMNQIAPEFLTPCFPPIS